MAAHRERRRIPYPSEQIFDLVADVERYPEFLPTWHRVAVRREPAVNSTEIYHTEQTLQLGPLQKTFLTRTSLERPSQIEVTSSDPLFNYFSMQWRFEARTPDACLVDFSLRCEAGSILLRPVLEVLIGETSHGIVKAFENRAHALYGDT